MLRRSAAATATAAAATGAVATARRRLCRRGMSVGSMTAALRRVLVRRPEAAFFDPELQEEFQYAGPRVDLHAVQREFDQFRALLQRSVQAATAGAGEVLEAGEVLPQEEVREEGMLTWERQARLCDAIFVHDPIIVAPHDSYVQLRMGKELRRGEEEWLGQALQKLGMRCLGKMTGGAIGEGGDMLYLPQAPATSAKAATAAATTTTTLAVGLGDRTNKEGVEQLREFLEPVGVRVMAVPLPPDETPCGCLHLQSLISFVDDRVAVVHGLLDNAFRKHLTDDLGVSLVEVTDAEFDAMATNILAVAPRTCIMMEAGTERVRRVLEEEHGIAVHAFAADNLCLALGGGPTCLTRPLHRSDV